MNDEPGGSNTAVPSFASYEELIPRVRTRRRKVWIVAAILALVLLGREGGFFDFYFYYLVAETHAHLTLDENSYHLEGERLTKTDHSQDSNTTTKARSWGVKWPWFRTPDLSLDLKNEIEQRLKNETQLSVQVKSIELEGLYWVPLYKSGTCTYRIYIQTVDKNSISFVGELTGKTDFSLAGTSALRNLRIAVADEIASRTRQYVRDTLK